MDDNFGQNALSRHITVNGITFNIRTVHPDEFIYGAPYDLPPNAFVQVDVSSASYSIILYSTRKLVDNNIEHHVQEAHAWLRDNAKEYANKLRGATND